MFQHCQIEFFPLSASIAEAQAMALRVRNKVTPHRSLTVDQITDYYCPVCQRLCAQICLPCWASQSRTSESVVTFANTQMQRHLGVDGVKWNPETNELQCRKSGGAKPDSFQDCKKNYLRNTGALLYKSGETMVLKASGASREVFKERFQTTCYSTKVIPVCLIGMAMRIGNDIIVLCATDGAKVRLSLETWGVNGPTCTAHVNDPVWPLLRPDRVMFSTVGPIPTTLNPDDLPNCLILNTQGLNWPQLEKKCAVESAYSGAFGLTESLLAVLAMKNMRAMPVMMPDRKDDGLLECPPVKTQRGKRQPTFSLGALNTYAIVGRNNYVEQVERMTHNDYLAMKDSHNHDILALCDRCIFCNAQRPRKNDSDWGMTVAQNENYKNVVVFFCKRDRTELFPDMHFEKNFKLYGLRQLLEMYSNYRLKKPYRPASAIKAKSAIG
jgi:hypothetical protein